MIVDRFDNAASYPLGPVWAEICTFLSTLSAESADGEYPLRGDEVFARVMSYTTKPADEGTLEAHRNYVDVQTVLAGAEGMEWFPQGTLTVRDPYDAARDAEFYQRPGPAPAQVTVVPGIFVVLWPQDAHLFGVAIGAPATVKKVVVKVRAELLALPKG